MIIERNRDNYHVLNWLDEFMVGHKGFIAGGCFKNIFNGGKIKDLDIFFHSQKDFDSACEHFDELCGEENDGAYRFYYENDKVKAYKHVKTGITLELCSNIFGTAAEIIAQFDFTVTKFAYFKKEVEDETPFDETALEAVKLTHIEYWICMDENFFEHLHLKRLVTDDKIPFPMSTFERMMRYIKYGYMPCKETKLKIAKAVNELSSEQIQANNSLYDGMD